MLEGDTEKSRVWRDQVDIWWAHELKIYNFTPRLSLQLVGTDAIRNHFHQDMWLLTAKNRIEKYPDKDVVISDVRFPNEVKLIQEMGGTLMQVKRGPDPVWLNIAIAANAGDEIAAQEMVDNFPEVHFSEWAWVGSTPTHIIDNSAGLDELYAKINDIV